ncbi:MAG: M23 family metallopeptidase [Peptostreptococcaceae bacterium]|nr:M23 family metallopeptidase [Peptostreptococcaceae bacterium]
MGKKPILAVLIILIMMLGACAAGKPVEQLVEKPVEQLSEAKIPLPLAEILMKDTQPGWVFSLEMENLKKDDQVSIETDMVHMQTFFHVTEDEDEWNRLFAVDTLNSGKKGFLIVSVKRDGRTIFRKKLDIGFTDRIFPSQELQISQELLERRIEAVSKGWEKFRMAIAKSVRTEEIYWDEAFIMPVEGRISTPFGARRTLNGDYGYIHSGIDLANKKGTPILAANSGKVVLAEVQSLTGNTIVIDHGRGLFTLYAHLEAMSVAIGDNVNRGQEIGAMGSTGFSTGSHLHFETQLMGVYIDPYILAEKSMELRKQMEREELK